MHSKILIMLKEYAKVFRTAIMIADAVLVVAAFIVSFVLSFFCFNTIPSFRYVLLVPLLIALWCLSLNHFRMYRGFRISTVALNIRIIAKSAVTSLIIFGFITYILKFTDISRSFIALNFLITTFFLIAVKTFLVVFFRQARKKGLNYRSYLVVGTGPRAQQFIEMIKAHDEWGLRVTGLVDRDPKKKGAKICGCSVLGDFSDIPEIIQNEIVDEVVFVVPRSWLNSIEEIMHFLEIQGVRVSVAVDYFALKLARSKQTDFHGIPLITFESTPDKIWHLVIKRTVDIIGSMTGILTLLPVLLIVGALVKLSSQGPVFFKQTRSGLNGRTFHLYKFRTMEQDAEAKLEQLREHNEMEGPVFKMENDPRVTSVGRILRKLSLDELPQLWNVFRGDMSLVGPRPPIPAEVVQYEPWQRRRLSMRPGITCIWQVKGRNTITDFDEWMKLDLEYIDEWSLWLDMKLLFLTIPAVLFAKGAK